MNLSETKKTWSITKKFRVGFSITLIVACVLYLFWLSFDLVFIKSGFQFADNTILTNNPKFYRATISLSYIFAIFALINFLIQLSYMIYRSFAFKTDKNKVIYEIALHSILSIISIIFIAISLNRLSTNKWVVGPTWATDISQLEIWNAKFAVWFTIIYVVSIISIIILFQADKAFKLVNIYFDICLITAIFALLALPIFIAATCLIIVYPMIETVHAFWLHIDGQIMYNIYGVMTFVIIFATGLSFILLIRLNTSRLRRTKKSMAISGLLFSSNVIMFVICRIFVYSAKQIYFNENWKVQMGLIGVANIFLLLAGWYSAIRYIDLYAKPARNLKKEAMILSSKSVLE